MRKTNSGNHTRNRIGAIAALCAGIALAAPAQARDVAAGEKIFKKCAACHQVGEGAKSRVGPALNGVVGRAAGSYEGFRYSDAMSGSGLIWTEEALADYLAAPRKFLPGNKMSFAGLRKPEDAANVIAYLASFQADGTRISE
jgi:cytochrome c